MGNLLSGVSNNYTSTSVGDLKIIELFIVVLILWVLVDLWVIFFRNFSRYTLGLNEKSTLHSFVFAFGVSVILLAFLILAGDTFQETLVNTGIVKEELKGSSLAQNAG
jgi:hypothetical protein